MKRIFLAILFFISSVLFCLQSASAEVDLKAESIKKLQRAVVKALPVETDIVRIAVLEFEGDNGTVQDAVTSAITEKTTFRVIEREDLDKILDEQGLQLKDIMDEQTRINHGRIKGVQGLLLGKVLGMEEGFLSYTIKAHFKLDDVEKGEIIFAKDFNVEAVSPVRNMLIIGAASVIGVILLLSGRAKRKATVAEKRVKADVAARHDLSTEVSKAMTNISGARTKLMDKGKSEEALVLKDVERDLLLLKEKIEGAASGLGLKSNKDLKEALKFDRKITGTFENLRKSTDKLYDSIISENAGNLGKDINILQKEIKNILNEIRDRKI